MTTYKVISYNSTKGIACKTVQAISKNAAENKLLNEGYNMYDDYYLITEKAYHDSHNKRYDMLMNKDRF